MRCLVTVDPSECQEKAVAVETEPQMNEAVEEVAEVVAGTTVELLE